MDKCVGKRAVTGDSLSRRGSGIVFRDHNHEDRIVQNRSRLQCSSRVNSAGGSQNGTPEKHKQLRASFRSMSGKAIAGNSSKPFSPSSSHRKSSREHQKQTFIQKTDVAGSSCRADDVESDSEQVPVDNVYSDGRQGIRQVSISIPKTTSTLRSSIFKGISTDIIKLSNSSSVASSSKGHKQISGQLMSGNQEASSKSLMPSSTFSSGNTSLTRAPRCGINNLGCALIPDVFPTGHSSTDLVCDRRIDMARKKSSDGESSASSSRGPSTTTSGGYSGSMPLETSVQNVLIPHRLMLEPVSRRNRNRITIRDSASSVRTRRTSQPSAEGRGSSPLLPSEAILTPQLHQQARNSIPEAVHENSSGAFAMELPHVFNNSYGRSSSNNRGIRSRAAFLAQDSRTQVPHDPSGDPHSYRHFNVEGVAEVLSALERIEQDEALTYEHLLFLESNLLRGSLRFHDQHRDMRMDIDNMSYEELLALEERMGTVSTALTDDQLSKCLKRTTFARASVVPGTNSYDNDDIKCSICQEEYIAGDEMGRLPCEHRYHVACINQWLRQKNWCPICKSCALPSSPETTQD